VKYEKDKAKKGKGEGEISALVYVGNLYIFGPLLITPRIRI